MLLKFPGRAAEPGSEITGKVRDGRKTAQSGDLLDLEGPVGKKGSCPVHSCRQQILLGGSLKKHPVIAVELTLSHIAAGTQAAGWPVFLTGA